MVVVDKFTDYRTCLFFSIAHSILERPILIERATSLIRRYRHINWTLTDQGIVSGTNFLTFVLLARYLGLEEFGWFVLVRAQVMLVRSLQAALIVSPMFSIGPKYPPEVGQRYYTVLFTQQIVLATLCSLLFILGIRVAELYSVDLAELNLVWPLAAMVFSDQIQDFTRRCFFARTRYLGAFVTDSVNCFGRLLGLVIVFRLSESASVSHALWVIVAASILSAIIGLFNHGRFQWDVTLFKEIGVRHWKFSKWLASSSVLNAAAKSIPLLIVSPILGMATIGAIRATYNVFGLVTLLTQSLQNLVPVQAAKRLDRGGKKALTRYLWRVTFYGGGATAIIAGIASAAPEFWLTLMYGEKFNEYSFLVYWYAVISIVAFLKLPLTAGLKALEDTRAIFISLVCVSVFALSSAYLLASWFGVHGTMFGRLCGTIIPLFVLSTIIARHVDVKETLMPKWRYIFRQ